MMKAIWTVWILVVFFLVSCATSMNKKGMSTPSFQPMKTIIDFYQGPLNHCSAVRYGECPMYPSCSEYCKQAFEKYGFFVGAMIAFDHLMRCGRDELKSAPLIFIQGKWKYYDPLEQNTSWWDDKQMSVIKNRRP
jgi:putative component of membrane protein insertase Oxa1/YidC/SpoIIIJ protein YidD